MDNQSFFFPPPLFMRGGPYWNTILLKWHHICQGIQSLLISVKLLYFIHKCSCKNSLFCKPSKCVILLIFGTICHNLIVKYRFSQVCLNCSSFKQGKVELLLLKPTPFTRLQKKYREAWFPGLRNHPVPGFPWCIVYRHRKFVLQSQHPAERSGARD